MKTMKYIAGAVLALAGMVACNQKEESLADSVEFTVTASFEGHDALTKTAVEDGGTQVFWEPSDEIKVFFKGSGGRFISQNTERAAVAEFSGTVSVIVGLNEGATGSNQLWGLYPYRQDACFDGSSVTTTLPADQTGRAGSFARNTHITLACSNSYDLSFYNVTGGLRFSLTQEGIKKVTFEANGGEAIAGTFKMAFEDGVPVVQEVTEELSLITLTAPSGSTFETDKWYYIEAIPGTLADGYTMMFYKENEEGKLKSTSPVTFKRGKYGSLSEADEGVAFNASQLPNSNEAIIFADPIAKYACVDKFDTNGDGEVSYAEAAAVTSLKGLFTDWNTVTSFDEIRYFTNVTSTEGVFTGLAKLTHITIPDNITTLGSFQNCSALETVTLPESLTSLPLSCFSCCYSLKSVNLPVGITVIPNGAFSSCTSLTGIVLPLGLQTIDESAFNNCPSLASIVFPSTIASIGSSAFTDCSALVSVVLPSGVSVGSNAFYGCSSLTSVVLPEDMVSIPCNCFSWCSKLATITWPKALSTIEDCAFYGCSFEDNDYTLQLPASVKTIRSWAFGYLHHLILPSTSPITIDPFSFKNGYTYTLLYVPANMVDMYKVRTNWSNYADRIRPIEDYPAVPTMGGKIGEAVDLGLSVKWASWNVGASVPEEYGEYFAWGEAVKTWKNSYSWSTYKWCNGDDKKVIKYCSIDQDGYWDGSGKPDGMVVLLLEDDAAYVNWGGGWRMPTDMEWAELLNNCTWEWATLNGVCGKLVTSNSNGNSIFLPAAGCRLNNTRLWDERFYGYYWSSTLNTGYPLSACNVFFDSGDVSRHEDSRSKGFSVRPVTE